MLNVSSLHKSCGISNFPLSISLLTSLIPAFTLSLSINDGTECSEFTGTGCCIDGIEDDSGKKLLPIEDDSGKKLLPIEDDSGKKLLPPEEESIKFSVGTELSKLFDTTSTIGFSEKAGRGCG